MLAVVALCQAAVVFLVGILRGLSPLDVFVNGFVTIMIGNVPQGLPTTLTACLTIVAERMGERNVFVKKLDVIETLGSCTLICTDKTGTLTKNLMTVAHTWWNGCKLSGEDFFEWCKTEQKLAGPAYLSHLLILMSAGALNSRVLLEQKAADSEPSPSGDASELGLYRFFGQTVAFRLGEDIETYRRNNVKLFEIPFNSEVKWQLSIHRMFDTSFNTISNSSQETIILKGAPDVVLKKCTHYLVFKPTKQPANSESPNQLANLVPFLSEIDSIFESDFMRAYEELGGDGERVIGYAMKSMPRALSVELSEDSHYTERLKENITNFTADHSKVWLYYSLNGEEIIRFTCSFLM